MDTEPSMGYGFDQGIMEVSKSHLKIIHFFVPGIPKTAGSKRAFIPKGWTRAIITDASGKAGKDWRGDIKRFASEHAPKELLTGPIEVTFTFQLPRPKGHFGSGKKSEFIKPSSPPFPITKPDVLKLARAAEDALTGVLYKDDSQIVNEHLHKRYGIPGVWIELAELGRTKNISG